MKFNHLAKLFYDWGWQINHEHYTMFTDYIKDMLKKNRVMVIMNADEVEGVIFFYLTQDYTQLYKKPTWAMIEDDPNGTQIYIDKLVCKKWTKELRLKLAQAIEEKFPNVELGVYHRAPFDRCTKIKTRRYYELQNSFSK